MSGKKMKVILNCSYYYFHRDYMLNIKNELESRGHVAIITESSDKINIPAKNIENFYIKNHSDADFTILPDEACSIIGGKGIYINHAILPVVPQHDFYYDRSFNKCINEKTFYMFLPSQDVSDIYVKELKLNKPVKIVGLPKLDNVFKKRTSIETIEQKLKKNTQLNIMYSPTGNWKKTMNSENIVNIHNLKQHGNIIYNGHPSIDKSNISLCENLSIADIVISDYSSVGYDAIALNIPTILIDNSNWDHISHKNRLICEEARNGSIRVKTMDELINAINIYKNNPKFLESERLHYGERLNKYNGNSSEIFVNELINIL
jgi:hypothetical protein